MSTSESLTFVAAPVVIATAAVAMPVVALGAAALAAAEALAERVDRARRRALEIPGLADDDQVCMRLVLADDLHTSLSSFGFRSEITEDHRGSAIWAESNDGLILAAVATDDGILRVDVANSRDDRCTRVVDALKSDLRTRGWVVGSLSEDRHDDPAGSMLTRSVREHLVAGGDRPSEALLAAMERPSWPPSVTPTRTPARRVRPS